MSSDGQRGDTLIEVLLAVMILGIGITGVIGAVGAGVSMATVQRDQVIAETALRQYAEAVRAEPYTACGTAAVAYTALQPVATGVTGLAASVTCNASDILQVVTVAVTSANDKVGTITLDVAKRRG